MLPHMEGKNVDIIHHVRKENLNHLRTRWVFSFVRDPCERVISSYAYLRDGGWSTEDDMDADKYVRPFSNLNDFVLHGLERASEQQKHFRPQSYWLADSDGRMTARFLGRTERLQSDFKRVCEACGWETPHIDIINRSKREGLVCTLLMRKVIERIYADDYRLLQQLELELESGLMGRILSVFRKNSLIEVRDSVWNQCVSISNQTTLTEENLKNMCQTHLVTGFGGGLGMKQVKAMAEALGICGISNPENNAYHGRYVPPPCNVDDLSADDILDRIQTQFPANIHFPPFTGNCLQGVHTQRHGTLTDRYMQYLWVFKLILELCPDRDSPIIEIGAGFGVLGYYLHGMGYRDYTVIDLSLTNACQTYFLSQNLPDRKLILSGDVPDPFDIRHRDAIKLLHSTDFHDVPAGRFALMVNMDGLTEMGIAEATKYVEHDCASMLLSINHEVNPYRVCDLKQPARKRQYRYPFWLREGYVEELYVKR